MRAAVIFAFCFVLLVRSADDIELSVLKAGIAAAERQITEARALADSEFDVWSDKLPEGPNILEPAGEMDVFSFDTFADTQTPNSVESGKPAELFGHPAIVDGHSGKALLLDGKNGARLAGSGGVTRSDPFTFSLWLRLDGASASGLVLEHAGFGFRLVLEKGKVGLGGSDSVKVMTKNSLAKQGWIHVSVSSDGSGRAAGMRVFVDGVLQSADAVPANARVADAAPAGVSIGCGFHEGGIKGSAIDDVRIFPRELAPVEVAALAGRDDFTKAVQSIPELTPAQRAFLLEYYIATAHGDSRTAREQLKSAREAARKYRETKQPAIR